MTRLPALLLTAALASCSTDIAGPAPLLNGIAAGLDVRLAVEPGEVAQHAPFMVRLDIRNTTPDTIHVVTAHGCLVLPHVVRDGRRIPFEGTAWGCTAAITTHVFAPGGGRSYAWPLRAELYSEHPGDPEGAPAPRGTYRLRAVFDVLMRGSGEKPAVETTLRVR
jgi:hypothetical protein